MNKEKQAIELLERARPYLYRPGPMSVAAVHISPAQSLRNQADDIEREESLIREIDEFLKTK